MQWLSENYKWLFDGVAGAAVIAAIGYLVQRLLKGSKNPPGATATLTAQGAKVTNSPVASGSGITQNINSPTINVSLPEEGTPSTPVEFFNRDGTSGPLNVSGRQHSTQDPSKLDCGVR
jgi:hypothetical protein